VRPQNFFQQQQTPLGSAVRQISLQQSGTPIEVPMNSFTPKPRSQKPAWASNISISPTAPPRPAAHPSAINYVVDGVQKILFDQSAKNKAQHNPTFNSQGPLRSITKFGSIPLISGRMSETEKKMTGYQDYQQIKEMRLQTINNPTKVPSVVLSHQINQARPVNQQQPSRPFSKNNLQPTQNIPNYSISNLPNLTMLSNFINKETCGFSAVDIFKIMSIHHFISSFGTLFWPDEDFSNLTLGLKY
jgi:hypothetical protein